MESSRATVRDLRRRNRSAVLSRLYFDGPLSRQELAQLTGLSAATVSNVTAALVDERLIVEAGQVDSDGGRPRVLLRVNPGYGHVVGIDVGETGVKAMAALRQGLQGTVVISAMIGADGKVRSCVVTQSSGSQLLDDTTCRLYARRGHFIPARDADGNAIPAQRTDRFRWQIPNE